MRLAGRVALVTGAAGGIGLACAQELAREGADVALLDRDGAGARAAAEAIAAETGRRTLAIACDVADAAAARAAVQQAGEALGVIDILVNNAGILKPGDILTTHAGGLRRRAGGQCPRRVRHRPGRGPGPGRAGKPGAIINMSSVNAVLAIPGQLPYVTSKGAINQLTKTMALGLAEHGIRVNAIGPGTIATEILKGVFKDEAAKRGVLARTPLKRIGEPREIGRVAVFLASEDASYMTGQTIYPDGGRLALNYTVAVD
jgi:NAD(P)-dependent dehydrogenase (short-subunit alcohol dehydrogenase family)